MSRVVARRGATVIVEQSGNATPWLFKIPLDVTFEINEIPPNGLQSRAVAGSLRALASNALTPDASGVRLDYSQSERSSKTADASRGDGHRRAFRALMSAHLQAHSRP